ncbi:MAG: sigma-70 family RNA polymerase sigma factor [Planctomycetaceae bacterium]|nr:sigma-70 family RNA polymerase sigma factor [Planctomycetaceae bacterium]
MTPKDLTNESDTKLVEFASAGGADALGILFERHREKIKRMIALRMDRRLSQRVDASDIVQETWLDCQRRLHEFTAADSLPFFAWLRFLAAQRLVDLHRIHIGAKMRSVKNEVQLYSGMLPAASSLSLAEHLVGNLTSASHAAQRGEIQMRIQEALNAMEPIDREVLALRHFEMLSNEETAAVLGLKKAAASNRYVRALKRLKATLDQFSSSL